MASEPKDRGRWGERRGVAEDRRSGKELRRGKEEERKAWERQIEIGQKDKTEK